MITNNYWYNGLFEKWLGFEKELRRNKSIHEILHFEFHESLLHSEFVATRNAIVETAKKPWRLNKSVCVIVEQERLERLLKGVVIETPAEKVVMAPVLGILKLRTPHKKESVCFVFFDCECSEKTYLDYKFIKNRSFYIIDASSDEDFLDETKTAKQKRTECLSLFFREKPKTKFFADGKSIETCLDDFLKKKEVKDFLNAS